MACSCKQLCNTLCIIFLMIFTTIILYFIWGNSDDSFIPLKAFLSTIFIVGIIMVVMVCASNEYVDYRNDSEMNSLDEIFSIANQVSTEPCTLMNDPESFIIDKN